MVDNDSMIYFFFLWVVFFFVVFLDLPAIDYTPITGDLSNKDFLIYVTFVFDTSLTGVKNRSKGQKVLKDYFTSSLFFQRRFLLRHFLHFIAPGAFLAPQSRQIFMYNLCF